MAGLDDWLEILRREIGIGIGQRQLKSTLVTTSYNPKTHAIKGIIQPHGVESGWVPLGTHGIGNKFGILMGPNVGSKEKLDGDQFDIEFEMGDPNTPIARHRLFSDKERPPEVQSGEILALSKFNAKVSLSKDGSVVITTKQKDVAEEKDNEAPNITTSATAGDHSMSATRANDKGGKITVTASDGDKKKHTITMDPVEGTATHKSTDDDQTHTIVLDIANGIASNSSGNITRTAQKVITDTATALNHNGPTNVQGTLGVSGLLSGLGGAVFGFNSFSVDESGTFEATSGGSVTGGLDVDLLETTSGANIFGGLVSDTVTVMNSVQLPIYSIAGLAAMVPPPIKGTMVYLRDTGATATPTFNAIPAAGGAITVNRPITYDGFNWRY